VGDGDEQIVYLLQIDFCHFKGTGVVWRSGGEKVKKMRGVVGLKGKRVFADSLSTRAHVSGVESEEYQNGQGSTGSSSTDHMFAENWI
jgi:hypothetical protein